VSEQGAGLFGAVWLAEDTTTGRPVAVRLLPRELTDIADVADTVRRRARAVVLARITRERPPRAAGRWRRGAGGLRPFRERRPSGARRGLAQSCARPYTIEANGTAAGPPRPAASAHPRSAAVRE
jgi:hypothetical protein